MSKDSPEAILAIGPGRLSSIQMISRANRVKPKVEVHQIDLVENGFPASITMKAGTGKTKSMRDKPGNTPEGVKEKFTEASKKND